MIAAPLQWPRSKPRTRRSPLGGWQCSTPDGHVGWGSSPLAAWTSWAWQNVTPNIVSPQPAPAWRVTTNGTGFDGAQRVEWLDAAHYALGGALQ